MADDYLHKLPVEVLYCIFDNLDAYCILRSLRPVSRRLYNIIKNYSQFNLNFISMSASDVRFIARFIEPHQIRSVTFSDSDTKRLDEINLFLSVFNIQQCNQLKALAFGQITIQSREILFALLEDVYLSMIFPLRLSNLDYLVQYIFHPVQCTLQHLTIRICTYNEYCIILRNLPSLRTFVLEYCDTGDNDSIVKSSPVNEKYKQLKSLTIYNCRLLIEDLRLFLILTPSLVHLKVASSRTVYGPLFDGSFWEQFIRLRLTKLMKFEFFFVYPAGRTARLRTINSIIATFRTPFWIDEKHWFATCDHVLKSSHIALYTKPFCINDSKILIRYKALPVNSVSHLIRPRTDERGDITLNETRTMLDLKGYNIGKDDMPDLFDALENEATSIDTLNLQENCLGDDGIERLAGALRMSKTITTLHLGNNQIGTYGARCLADVIQNNTILHTLYLQLNCFEDDGIKQLADALKLSTTITTLYLGNNRIGTYGAQCLAEVLRTNATLHTLDLPTNEIRNEGAQYLADGLRHNTTLTTLNLRFNRMGDNEAQHLAIALENNTALTTLDLGGNNFGASGMELLAQALKRNTTLTTLYLEGNNFGAKGAECLSKTLPCMRALISLNLSYNQIWDKGARFLADGLQSNTSLAILDLAANDIEDPGAQYLADVLRNNTVLTTLNLSRNRIGNEILQMIDELLVKNLQMKSSD